MAIRDFTVEAGDVGDLDFEIRIGRDLVVDRVSEVHSCGGGRHTATDRAQSAYVLDVRDSEPYKACRI